MHPRLRHPSAGLVVAFIALFVAIGGTSLAATGMFSGTQIKKGSIPLNRLATGVQQSIKQGGERGPKGDTGKSGKQGASGPEGKQGTQGAAGPEGKQGPTGVAGPEGKQGPTGATGPEGAAGGDVNRLTTVSTLPAFSADAPAEWTQENGTCEVDEAGEIGQSSLGEEGLEISVPTAIAFGGAQYQPQDITLAELSSLSYTERYSGSGGAGVGPAYVQINVEEAGGGSVEITFTPSDQAAPHAEGTWQTWQVLSPSSVLNVEHTGRKSVEEVITAYGTDSIQDIQVEAGCSTSPGTWTAKVSSVKMEAGSQLLDFLFGGV